MQVVGAGAMHVVVLTSASSDPASTLPPLTTGDLLTTRADIVKPAEQVEEEKKDGDAGE